MLLSRLVIVAAVVPCVLASENDAHPPPTPPPFESSSTECCTKLDMSLDYGWLPVDQFKDGPDQGQKYKDALPKSPTFELNKTIGNWNFKPVYTYLWKNDLDPEEFHLPDEVLFYLFYVEMEIGGAVGDQTVGWVLSMDDPYSPKWPSNANLIAGTKAVDSLSCPQDIPAYLFGLSSGQKQTWYGLYGTELFKTSGIVELNDGHGKFSVEGADGTCDMGCVYWWYQNYVWILACIIALIVLVILCFCFVCPCCPGKKWLKRRAAARAGQDPLLADHMRITGEVPRMQPATPVAVQPQAGGV